MRSVQWFHADAFDTTTLMPDSCYIAENAVIIGSVILRRRDRSPQMTLPCRMSLTSSGEQPSHSP